MSKKLDDARENSRLLGFYLFPPIGAIVLLAVLSLFSLQEIRRCEKASDLSRQLQVDLNTLLRELLNAETGQRGFLLTEDGSYLEPYYSARSNIMLKFGTLMHQIQDPRISALVEQAKTLATEKLSELEKILEMARAGNMTQAQDRLREGRGKVIMDEFRSAISLAESRFSQEIVNRDEESWRAYFSAVGLASIAILLSLLAIIWSLLRVDRELQMRRKSEAIVRERAVQLQSFADIASRISTGRDTSSIIGIALNEFRQLIGCREALIQLLSNDGVRIERGVIASGVQEPSHDYLACIFELVNRMSSGRATYYRKHSEIMKLEEVTSTRAWKICGDAMDGVLSAPIVNNRRQEIGRFVLMGKFGAEFNDNDTSIVSQLAFTLSVAIENARLNEQANQTTEKKDEFLAMLGHELRNPLAGVLTGCEALMQDSVSTSKEVARPLMEAIFRQSKIMQHLVNDLLDVSRIGKGKINLARSSCDVDRLVKNAVSDYCKVYPEREILFTGLDNGEKVFVDADQVRMTQCITNLLHNACKFSRDASPVTIRIQRAPKGAEVFDSVSILVIDQGIGLDEIELRSIFDLFYQSNKSIARSQGGLGIGLALAKTLIELHGGQLKASSDGRGRGATFTINLPIQSIVDEKTSPAQSSNLSYGDKPKKKELLRILAIDDRIDAILPIRVLMTRDGHQVIESNDGQDGIQKAKQYRPDLVLCDIGLPGAMTGYDVVRTMRSDMDLKDLYIVALSGYSQTTDREKSRDAGFDYHIAKPIDLSTLRHLVDNRPKF